MGTMFGHQKYLFINEHFIINHVRLLNFKPFPTQQRYFVQATQCQLSLLMLEHMQISLLHAQLGPILSYIIHAEVA